MSEIVERVAKSMWLKRMKFSAHHGVMLEPWGDGSTPKANGILEEARAAIEAMREPTEKMQQKASDETDTGEMFSRILPDDCAEIYQTMIDAALSEPKAENDHQD